MSSNRRNGNAAEAFVQRLLQEENPGVPILPLQQDAPADLVALFPTGSIVYEVKSSKLRRRALTAHLTDGESMLKARLGERYVIIRVLRVPGRPKDTFEVLTRGT